MFILPFYHLSHALKASPFGMFFFIVIWACQSYYILVLCLWVRSWLSHMSIPIIYHLSQVLRASPLGMFFFYSHLGILSLLHFSIMFVGSILVLSYIHPTFLPFESCLKG